MNTEISKSEFVSPEIIQNLILEGDISKMSGDQRVEYVTKLCSSLGLNALTKPFQILKLQGKETLYATKDCTEQLRKVHGVSITDVSASQLNDIYVVTAKALDKNGKTDASTGAVTIGNLKGDNLANALMKAETKAKRRVTLSICGLGMLDESEIETIPGAEKVTATAIVTEPTTSEKVASMQRNSKKEPVEEKQTTADVPQEVLNAIDTAATIADLQQVYNTYQDLRESKTFIDALTARKKALKP